MRQYSFFHSKIDSSSLLDLHSNFESIYSLCRKLSALIQYQSDQFENNFNQLQEETEKELKKLSNDLISIRNSRVYPDSLAISNLIDALSK